MKNNLLILFILIAVFLASHSKISAEKISSHLYVTGTVMEIDRCASAWLIKRYVDEDAEFNFLSDQRLMVTDAISFDTPYSELRRTHTHSTFESIQNKYLLNDDKIKFLAQLIHELEINFWNKQVEKKAVHFQFELEKILQETADPHKALQQCFKYLDSLEFHNA